MNRGSGINKLALVHGAISAMVSSFGAQLAAQTAIARDMESSKASRQRSVKPSMIHSVLWYPNNGTYRTPEGLQRMKDRRIAYRSRSHALSKLSNTKKRALGIPV